MIRHCVQTRLYGWQTAINMYLLKAKRNAACSFPIIKQTTMIINNYSENSKGIIFAQQYRETPFDLALVQDLLASVNRYHQKAQALAAELNKEGLSEAKKTELCASLQKQQKIITEELKSLREIFGETNTLPKAKPHPPYRNEKWIRMAFETFFDQWTCDMAEFQLWLMTKQILCATDPFSLEERNEAASFYELAKLLIEAAHALHEAQTKTPG